MSTRRTKIADQIGLGSIGCPFPVDDVAILQDIEAEFLVALELELSCCQPIGIMHTSQCSCSRFGINIPC